MPRWVLAAGGVVVPIMREVAGVVYQFDRPFVVDASETTEVFGVQPSDWDALIDATAAAWHERAVRPAVG